MPYASMLLLSYYAKNLTGGFSDLLIWVILMKSYLVVVDVHMSTH